MTKDTPSQHKQIIYASFFSRIFAALLDCFFLFFLLPPFTVITNKLIYKNTMHPETFFKEKVASLPADTGLKTIFNEQFYNYFIESGVIYKASLDLLIQISLISVIVLFFWIKKQATPGKLIMKIRIVDQKSLKPITTHQSFVRFLSYFLAALPLFGGFIIMGFNPKKRGLHDFIAGTCVIKG
jgi:uncharacterized RDD family membrane protein YckC